MNVPSLVAHRGYPAHYPENTIVGIEAALRAGARYVEFDVQLCSDGVPVLLHDIELQRTTGVPGCVLDMPFDQLAGISAGEPDRLGEQFCNEPIPSLQSLVELMKAWPQATAFVELKRSSLRRFGLGRMLERVAEVMEPIASRCAIVSFDPDCLQLVRTEKLCRIGWVMQKWNDESFAIAGDLDPDFLFVDHRKIPSDSDTSWCGSWSWVLYDVVDAELALNWFDWGADLIETFSIGELLQHQMFAEQQHQAAGS